MLLICLADVMQLRARGVIATGRRVPRTFTALFGVDIKLFLLILSVYTRSATGIPTGKNIATDYGRLTTFAHRSLTHDATHDARS